MNLSIFNSLTNIYICGPKIRKIDDGDVEDIKEEVEETNGGERRKGIEGLAHRYLLKNWP